MFDFAQIEEVKLGAGNHSSPSDGLCFMEMAAWFAGEKHSDKPDCSCRVLGAYGISLNDAMPDDVRDTLLKPLVPLIVGTRDPASEVRRAEFLAMWATNKILPIMLRERGFVKEAEACERAGNLAEAKSAANAAAAYAAKAANAAANAAYAAANAAANAAYAAAKIWSVAAEGLRQAIMLGRHEGCGVCETVLIERREKLVQLVR